MSRARKRGGHTIAEDPEVFTGINTLVIEVDSHGIAPLEGEGYRDEVGQRLFTYCHINSVAGDATNTLLIVNHTNHIRDVSMNIFGSDNGGGVLAKRGPKILVAFGGGMGVGGIESSTVDTAERRVGAKIGLRSPISGDAGVGIPDATEFVVDKDIDGEGTGSVGRGYLRQRGGDSIYLDATIVTEVVIMILRVGIGFPHQGVDADGILAVVVLSDTADIH